MWPLWWWPQELMQPLMCRSMSPMSYSSSRSSKRSVIASAIGIERALASAQKSPPGQAIMSVSRPMFGVAKPALRAACHSAGRSSSCTQGSSRFWSCVTRSFAGAEAVGQLGGDVHLVVGGVAGRLAEALERQRHGARSRVAGGGARCAPASGRIPGRPRRRRGRSRAPWPRRLRGCTAAGSTKRAATRSSSAWVMVCGAAVALEDAAELGVHLVDELLALGLDQDLDARLVHVVAPAVAVVDAHDRLDVDEDLLPRQELADHRADDRRAAHAAADQHLEADFAGFVLAAAAGRCRARRSRRGLPSRR